MSTAWLLIAVAGMHYSPDVLAAGGWGDAPTWFYILRGVFGAGVFWVWRNAKPSRVWWGLCVWGFVEESMVSTCGTLYLAKPVLPGGFEGLCDKQTGLPLYAIGLTIVAVLAVIAYRGVKNASTERD